MGCRIVFQQIFTATEIRSLDDSIVTHKWKGNLIVSEKAEKDAEKNDKIRQLINHGTEIAGGAAGAALGLLIGGPVGAVVGGAGGPMAAITLRSIGQEILERQLGPQEKVRVGAAFAIAAADIRQRIENGESIRTNGFFDEKQTGRSDAEEVAESMLLKVQREPEEKKIQYMGYLLSSIAFDPQISVHMAHQLVKASEQLTYRQLCILKLCVVKDNFLHNRRNTGYPKLYQGGVNNLTKELYQVLHEYWDLYLRGFIWFGETIGDHDIEFNPSGMIPEMANVLGMGEDLFNLMKLSLIPDKDIAPIAAQLE